MGLGYDSYEEALEARREWERRSKPLTRKSRLDRGGPIRKRNEKRARERRERDFGEKAWWVKGLPCAVCGDTPCDPHHEPPRSRGGTKEDLAPLCRRHHTAGSDSRHELGSVEAFREAHGVDLKAVARETDRKWRERDVRQP